MGAKVKQAMWARLFERTGAEGGGLQDRLRRMMAAAILEKRFPVGHSLPSSRDLSAELGIGRNTVILAYQQMVDEGFLISEERRGHFINPTILANDLQPATTIESPIHQEIDWKTRLRITPSAMRKIDKPRDWQEYKYPFLYGQFDPQLFPVADWRECSRMALSVLEIRGWASDLIERDDPLLVEQLQLHVLSRRGIWARPDEIMVTIGAQHALYVLSELLVRADTIVCMENPGYGEARNVFAVKNARILGLPIDSEGLIVGERLSCSDYVFVTPSHQCPTTVTMPIERRMALLDRAARDGFVVIEDDYEPETGFDGTPTPALKSLDMNGRVLYVGSLSKTLAPGLRLGFIVGPAELVREARAMRRLMVRHPAANNQRAAALFLAHGHYEGLQRRLQHAVRQRAEVLIEAFGRHLPQCRLTLHQGGSSAWVEGPVWLDARALAARAKQRSVLIEPGEAFFVAERPPLNYFRMGISSIAVDRIENGLRELALAIDELAP